MNRLGWHQIEGSPPAGDVTVTPAGDITATDVQGALEQLDSRIGAGGSGGGGGGTTPTLLVRDGVVPLEPVGMDGDPDTWLYADTTAATPGGGGVTDHGALTGLADNDHPQYIRGTTGRRFIAVGGVLRKDNGSWFLINDTSHAPLNLGAITVTSTDVTIAVTAGLTVSPRTGKTVSVVVTPDETYAKDHTVGGSIGVDHITLYIYKSGVRQNPQTMPDNPLANFWIYGLMEAI